MACLCVCLCVCLSVTLVSPAKTTKPIEIELPFAELTWFGSRNHLFDGIQILKKKGNFGGSLFIVPSMHSWTDINDI